MKLRLFTGLALALALGGCSTYGYVGDGGGGYYTGGSATRYVYPSYSYGYGGGYGSSYYRYSPGLSFGLGYGYPYGYGGYGYGYYPRYPVYPPYYHRPPPRPRPDQNGPGHGRPDRPPEAGNHRPPPPGRAPWRDLERLRRGDGENDGPPRRQPGPGTLGADGPYPSTRHPGAQTGAVVMPRPGVVNRPRVVGMDAGDGERPIRQIRPASNPRSTPRAAPSMSQSPRSGPGRSATHDTDEP